MANETDKAPVSKIAPGDFPYPLTKGPEESRYLTWLRNHSNYMATRGFLDYLRLAAVLVRGILLNFLILLPWFLIVSLVVGHLYGPQLRSLPSADDLPLENLDELAMTLKEGTRPVDQWLREKLSDETREALEANRKTELQVALSKDLRNLIARPESLAKLVTLDTSVDQSAGDGIKDNFTKAEPEGRVAAPEPKWWQIKALSGWWVSKQELLSGWWRNKKELLPPNLWVATMKSLAENSRSHIRLGNRRYLEEFYPEITKLNRSNAGPLEETGILPPMPVPFALTRAVFVAALLVVLLSPIVVLYREIAGHTKSIQRAGSDSSVEIRDRFERIFGLLLLAILAFALFETLPVLVDIFHQFRVLPEMNWTAIFASTASVSVAVLGGASKLLSVLGGAKKKVAMLLIGLIGMLAPLLVILYVSEFLVYRPSPDGWIRYIHLGLPIGFILMILGGIVVGIRNKTLKSSELVRGLAMILALIVATIAIWVFIESYEKRDVAHEWNFWFVAIGAIELGAFCWWIVDVNRTSIHGMYRDRLAAAYLVGLDTEGDVAIEEDINLGEIGCYDAGSTAPYHLLNASLNLQGSDDSSIRDRQSDFFIFSKRFIGGRRTGYCRTATLEQVHPQMSVATAMAISAAAASPNMGRGTNPALVATMVLLNIRLGYWLPNPGLLEEELSGSVSKKFRRRSKNAKKPPPGFTFDEVFEQELIDIEKRWDNVYPDASERQQRGLHLANVQPVARPTTEHGLVGIGFSGGGIRSATINLGFSQALHARGVFDHVDYLSTVSGGGYLGSSLSTLMRRKYKSGGDDTGSPGGQASEIEGVVDVETNAKGETIVKVTGTSVPGEQREYRFSRLDPVAVKTGDTVDAGQELVRRHDTLWDRFRWRVWAWALLREMRMKLDERYKWVNLSDGGHIENLGCMELLRRRCKFIIIGDGEADPEVTFNALAILIRTARIDLGIDIDIHPDAMRVDRSEDAVYQGKDNLSEEHCAFGTITYPPDEDNGQQQEEGYLLYLKSSCTGDEDEVIKEYRRRNPAFPQESTADQFFDEDQFECYRALGQHMGEQALLEMSILEPGRSTRMTYEAFSNAFSSRARVNVALAEAELRDQVGKKWDKWLAAQESLGGETV